MSEVILNDENFSDEVLNSKTPVLVDFWAPWCGPCRIQGPIIEELAKEYAGKGVKIAKLNVDEAPNSAGKFQVMSIPTLMIFDGGKPREQMIGVQNKGTLKEKIDSLI
ncbi:thioredoxin [Candidatus Falkowbacteria bacterium]|nr:thioredoxin [Candidatus Falkowbacteria bacterium]